VGTQVKHGWHISGEAKAPWFLFGVFSQKLLSAEPEEELTAWDCGCWRVICCVLILKLHCRHLPLLNLRFVLDLDVSMDAWGFFCTCLVSVWLHRFYIYSAVAFGISVWIVVQFTTAKTKKKVTEHVSTFV